ncbi:Carbohydrate-binding WSC subgroup [Penicillium angulare]|uniref:Carbohydrate-binding WSC subgroup n=1 Tax=Penicillium angulare TaxID=116970 RepID=UPI00254084C3|nr:Carbohydrate-binding WSC subgroup [Penicillium angulare]KAJ5280404.1 Carbohydrate-binding WSC subgroup [Penicillium angulare]
MHASIFLSTLALLPRALASSDLAYCATENTGTSGAVVNNYQSNGACEDTCASYGLGILQYKDCWCSNVAPANSSTVETTKCDSACPGYPSDSCGSASKGVYAYILINSKSISSTATAASISHTEAGTTTTANVALTTSANGDVKTITVAASESTSSSDATTSSTSDKGSSGLGGGSIAGIVVGVVGGLALVGALVFLIFFYRKRARSASPVPSGDMTDRNSQASNWSRGVFPGGTGGSMNRQNTFTDNRMRNGVYPNGSRDSSVSLQDNEDYSRPVLRLANPD